MKRLFLSELSDQHLTWLQKAIEFSNGVKMEDWLEDWQGGELEVFEVINGIVGLRRTRLGVFVEFLAGSDMRGSARDILAAVKDVAGGEVEAFVTRPGLVRFYERLGFKSLGTTMRLA